MNRVQPVQSAHGRAEGLPQTTSRANRRLNTDASRLSKPACSSPANASATSRGERTRSRSVSVPGRPGTAFRRASLSATIHQLSSSRVASAAARVASSTARLPSGVSRFQGAVSDTTLRVVVAYSSANT